MSEYVPDCASLSHEAEYPPWLTLPLSRIVVNPWDVTSRPDYPVPSGMESSAPLHLAYHVGQVPVRLPFFLSWVFPSNDILRNSCVTWAPHAISQNLMSGEHRTIITTCFADESTVMQSFVVGFAGQLLLMGQFAGGDITWSPATATLTLTHPLFAADVSISRPARPLAGSARGVWALDLGNLRAGEEVVVSVHFRRASESSLSHTGIRSFHDVLHTRELYWNERLGTVPRPAGFDLHFLNRPEAHPDAVRRMYYRAWAFLISNSLPPMPENGYSYPQIACGKPSLWAEGHPMASASAQWESFVAMQLMAWIDPDLAWSAFEGMMSLVDDNGTLGGEGLPSRHVQTAWVLYQLTGAADRLHSVYPAMKRLLLWKASDPRWIFKDQTPPGLKDAEFVVHALMDMFWAMHVCQALNLYEEVAFWREHIDLLAEDYRRWFWDDPQSEPHFTFHELTGRHSGDRRSWSLQGLALPEWILGDDRRRSLLVLLRTMMDDRVPFLIRGLNKFPQCNFTMVGAWTHGTPEEAAILAEAGMSAVTMAGEFAECYTDEFPVQVWGVAPSVFGAASIIDCALWHNGVILGDGLPILARMPNAVGVSNFRLMGSTFGVEYCGSGVTLYGDALRRLSLPVSFETSSHDCWKDTWQTGRQIVLQTTDTLSSST